MPLLLQLQPLQQRLKQHILQLNLYLPQQDLLVESFKD
jgi:hypothetical protein